MSDRAAQPTIARLLGRVAFAASAADVDYVRTCGFAAHVERQLAWRSLDDSALATDLARMLPALDLDRAGLAAAAASGQRPEAEWRAATRARRGASRCQLYEVMVEFWSRWFGLADGIDAMLHERDVVRPHALGRYGDLLKASARSAAMLTRDRHRWLGDLTGRYSRGNMGACDTELAEASRCFSGWTADPCSGGLRFVAAQHDYGAKIVLGVLLPAGGGIADGDTLIDRLATHPATARHVATRLVRRFVGDEPHDLVDLTAIAFTASHGDIAATLRFVLGSARFYASVGLDAELAGRD